MGNCRVGSAFTAHKEKSAISRQAQSSTKESGSWSKREWNELMQDSSLTVFLSGKEAISSDEEYPAVTQVAKYI